VSRRYLARSKIFFERAFDPAMTGIDGNGTNGLSNVIQIPDNESLFTHYQQFTAMTNSHGKAHEGLSPSG